VLLALLVIGICLGMADGPARSPGAVAWLGAASGLAVWFTPTNGIALAACVVTWLLLARRPSAREALALAAGFGLGFAPWLLYNGLNE
jgi:hypothetical protein